MFVAGTAVGAVAALMMAPASGRESREYLRRQSRRMADDAAAQADRVASAVRWGQEQATSAMNATMDQAKAAFNAAATPFRNGEATSPSAHMSQGPSATSARPTSTRSMS